MTHDFAIQPDPAEVGVARALCVQTLSTLVATTAKAHRLVDDAAVITSELVTNSIQAGAARIRLQLERDGDRFRIAVHDDAAGDVAQRVPDVLRPGGRGLFIVASLAEAWGVQHDPPGKTVWADLNLRELEPRAAGEDAGVVSAGHAVAPQLRSIEEI